jgi:hypothetical protein
MKEAATILAKTPASLDALLRELPDRWVRAHEGVDTWSPFDVVGHLIHAERTNWLPRARIIIEQGQTRPFDDFDRSGHVRQSERETMASLLDAFAEVRKKSLAAVAAMDPANLDRLGLHPSLGAVTLRQLLAAWVVHDLDHVMQITRVMARQYTDEVGPWRQYLRIVREV